MQNVLNNVMADLEVLFTDGIAVDAVTGSVFS